MLVIVTCEECSTSFELDETRIPATGARVRCSRCKHAFFLANPSASASEGVQSVVEEAVADPQAVIPDPTEDLGASTATASRLPKPESEPDEESWEFSEEVRSEDDDVSDFGSASDLDERFDASALASDVGSDALETDVDSSESLLDVEIQADEDAESGLEIDGEFSAPDVGIEAGHDDSSFGDIDDFSPDDEDDLDVSADAISEDAVAAAATSAAAASPSPLGDLKDSLADDTEDPENWDLAPDADFGAAGPSSAISAGRSAKAPQFSAEAAVTDALLGHGGADTYADDFESGSVFSGVLGVAGSAVGWVVTLGAIAALGFVALQSEWERLTPVQQTLAVGDFSVETTQSEWVETLRAGRVLVVEGIAQNNGAAARMPDALEIALLDAGGTQLDVSPFVVGTPLHERTLREASVAELSSATLRARSQLLTTPFAAGESRAFQAVLLSLPKDADRLLIEVAGNTRAIAPRATAGVDIESNQLAPGFETAADEGVPNATGATESQPDAGTLNAALSGDGLLGEGLAGQGGVTEAAAGTATVGTPTPVQSPAAAEVDRGEN